VADLHARDIGESMTGAAREIANTDPEAADERLRGRVGLDHGLVPGFR
jgi:hypothetical protein